ncbi:5-formyltetrahydrofolate cyclo-ligase [Mycolicibacterium goodii]|uniref:5-formyltetrahydrofolate cyclo-ligase n=1 Tax=Mycolicibacterium goodii TaxID=134601 RepID=A0ABS6HZB1_MYCGD|nr:5-formyltetrahydrofolate cyclo-ligase [Mycolicibacterium goodii]MBU8817074.1 5-formyltetrahydrofolate cyclo-ligase [Mycolicibacterium goodii]MBU8827275.1 5-formyltetrahydrofolate cyclo-ligase [Mycolicibacterium goodii]MBU8833679.1 5-formyltetrahydrofolate cyclo-ligase [Mycolicibacterium goodii]MBU8835380.1 5-formyltetrahydrofolate cyclo-ligase [Mycolicibacterium goodii]ULN46557.1 5-formyltetrahydrofolate cyclo-ligase [Mycolicibacterium goodii]
MVEPVSPTSKPQLRAALLQNRRSLPRDVHDAEAKALCDWLSGLVVAGQTVCAYVPVGSEPGSIGLLDTLLDLGATVLLPVARNDADGSPRPLQWGRYRPGTLVRAEFGLREPPPPWLPPDAVGDADVILVPALAVDRSGARLGRGAGFYDRTLGLAAPSVRLVAVVRDDELLDELPAEPHDVAMTHALTPARGVVDLRG